MAKGPFDTALKALALRHGASCDHAEDALVLELPMHALLEAMKTLKNHVDLDCALLLDVCGVDFLHYGLDEWATISGTASGFSRGRVPLAAQSAAPDKPGRFQVVYHLLSLRFCKRVRVKVKVDIEWPVASVTSLWPSAAWFEREVFDLFGIAFSDHPDLRRILTDYGFNGHPFRKDFPLEGEVEMHYDGAEGKCVYAPCSIQPRVTVPKVIRKDDHRYKQEAALDDNR